MHPAVPPSMIVWFSVKMHTKRANAARFGAWQPRDFVGAHETLGGFRRQNPELSW